MRSSLLMAVQMLALLGLMSCSPSYPAAKAPEGLCANHSCTIGDAPSELYYSKFMAGVQGSCADQANMKFTSMVAQAIMTKEADGFAEIHLYLDHSGHYTGAYALSSGAFGTLNPVTKGQRTLKKISGSFYLSDDKIVIDKIGIGRKNTDVEMLLQPISSSPLSMTGSSLISFTAVQSDTNEQGQSVAEYCATQAAGAAPAAQ